MANIDPIITYAYDFRLILTIKLDVVEIKNYPQFINPKLIEPMLENWYKNIHLATDHQHQSENAYFQSSARMSAAALARDYDSSGF